MLLLGRDSSSFFSSDSLGRAIRINQSEVKLTAIRSPGNGGQNVNKLSTAIHLRFSIPDSSLPFWVKKRLLELHDSRITGDGVVILKANSHRTQEQNREDALDRLQKLVDLATVEVKKRCATKPTRGSQERRIAGKSKRGDIMEGRRRVDWG